MNTARSVNKTRTFCRMWLLSMFETCSLCLLRGVLVTCSVSIFAIFLALFKASQAQVVGESGAVGGGP